MTRPAIGIGIGAMVMFLAMTWFNPTRISKADLVASMLDHKTTICTGENKNHCHFVYQYRAHELYELVRIAP